MISGITQILPLQRYGAALVDSLTNLLKELKSEATVLVYKVCFAGFFFELDSLS
jgi:hypothetical protein